ncbi:YvcK family protein [bacterium]|nr:YvcK family protein [bacterium]
MIKKIKFSKNAIWFFPGLNLKRWFLLIVLGAILATLGAIFLFKLEPLVYLVQASKQLIKVIPAELIGVILMVAGVCIFLLAWKKTNTSMLDAASKGGQGEISESLYRKFKLNRGPKIVAIGGGTGLSTILRGLKKLTNNVTAVVTVGDDGGSSGRLREEMGVLPPGDIRNCVAALADDDDIVTKLFQYRFKTGEGLGGHSFGNLFITALSAICGDMITAIKESSKVLRIRGRVLPATVDDMRLVGKMEDGSIIKGESNIPEAGKRIIELSTEPEVCMPAQDVIEAILDADIIILGPGSLYTSVIPNILVGNLALAIEKSKAKKIYVCNIMTQPGETDNYTVSDHIQTLFKHAKLRGVTTNLFDAVLVNDFIPRNLSEKYEEANSYPVEFDIN